MNQSQTVDRLQRLAVVLAFLLMAPLGVWAQTSPGVARVSLLDGQVSLLRHGDTEWTSAALNTPLVSGDEVYVPGDGRAEVEFDAFDVARLSNDTDIALTSFFGQDLHLQMRSGTMSYTTVGRNFLPAEISTPNMSVRPLHPGVIRIDVVDASHTSVIVWSGAAEVFSAQGRVQVDAGQQIQVQGQTNPEYQVIDAPAEDAWDRWVQNREARVEDARSYRYMNRDIYGGADLDEYGHWVYVPNYGHCWRPGYVDAGWSPYHYGRWVWTPYYGWTWVSYEPWGWAPYHYGRWFFSAGFGWVWWPGSPYGQPVWAPAYVSFFVGGHNWGLSVGFGSGAIGWVPLAPYERYYGFDRDRYITRYTSITTINNYYYGRGGYGRYGRDGHMRSPMYLRNARAPGGIIAVSDHQFADGRVDRAARIIAPTRLTNLRGVRGTAPVAPTLRSLRPLPGHGAMGAPARLSRMPMFHQTSFEAARGPRTMAMPQIERAMRQARTGAGLRNPAPVFHQAVATRSLGGGGAAVRGYGMSMPQQMNRGSNWHRFGGGMPAMDSGNRNLQGSFQRPGRTSSRTGFSSPDRGFRRFSSNGMSGSVQRNGIVRGTSGYRMSGVPGRPPTPSRPSSPSRPGFENHPMGTGGGHWNWNGSRGDRGGYQNQGNYHQGNYGNRGDSSTYRNQGNYNNSGAYGNRGNRGYSGNQGSYRNQGGHGAYGGSGNHGNYGASGNRGYGGGMRQAPVRQWNSAPARQQVRGYGRGPSVNYQRPAMRSESRGVQRSSGGGGGHMQAPHGDARDGGGGGHRH